MGQAVRYRPEIAGLRAVAVIPIVLIHAGFTRVTGGTFGVDVFFVISGYLITRILLHDMDAGRMDVLDFYRRRAVRLLPALAALLVVVLAAGYGLLLSGDLHALAWSAASTAGFGANVFFLLDTDYFSPAAEYKPLLHAWSLGVEEQFYLLYPAFILALRARPGVALTCLVLGSFGVAAWLAADWPVAAFYMLPARAWELGLGGLVATGALPRLASPRLRHGAALVGLGAIAAAMVGINPAVVPLPFAALPACLGAATVIAYGEDGPAARCLSLPPLRWIGAISYSLYLWHWPILVFWRLEYGPGPGHAVAALLIGLAVLVATLSYYLVERPTARYGRRAPAGRMLCAAVATMAAVALAAVSIAHIVPRWQRSNPAISRFASYGRPTDDPAYVYQYRPHACFMLPRDRFDAAHCVAIDSTRTNVLVAGDSHAADMWRALAERNPQVNLLQGTASDCKPLLNVRATTRCAGFTRALFGTVLARRRVSRVVLSAAWQPSDAAALVATIRFLQAHHVAVTVIGPRIKYGDTLPRLLARAVRDGETVLRLPANVAETHATEQALRSDVVTAGARYVSAYAAMCPMDRCRVVAPDGTPLYVDQDHLTLPGARWLAAHVTMP